MKTNKPLWIKCIPFTSAVQIFHQSIWFKSDEVIVDYWGALPLVKANTKFSAQL